jgi:hypothetical protein
MSQVGTRIRAYHTVLVLGVLLFLPHAAVAASSGLGPGVHVDPGSPAAKEYAVPLGSARGGTPTPGAGSGQLFGAGITKADASSSAGGYVAPSSGSSSQPASGTSHHPRRHRGATPARRRNPVRSATPGSPAPRAAPSPQNVIGTSSNSGSGITWMLGAAVVVLLLGGVGGAALARRGRRSDPDPYPS